MRNRLLKMAGSVVLTAAVALSSVVAVPQAPKADAASSYPAYIFFADSTWKNTNFDTTNSASTSTKKVPAKGKISVSNTKGTKAYTITLKKSDCVNQKTGKNDKTKIKDVAVFGVDVLNIIKDHKVKNNHTNYWKVKPDNLKFSNVAIKVDGKNVKLNQKKILQGWVEDGKNQGKNYRLDIFNKYNKSGDGSQGAPCAKSTAFAFKKQISVSFKFTIKK